MKPVLFFLLLALGGALNSHAQSAPGLDRAAFYEAMASTDPASQDKQISQVSQLNFPLKTGFEGALQMRKAGLIKGARSKLSLFKEGNKKLESSIAQAPDNAELRFLRLMIQEKAPKILGYDSDKAADADLIRSKFSQLPTALQKAIRSYSKSSSTLQATDF